jgi:hypothetical protein
MTMPRLGLLLLLSLHALVPLAVAEDAPKPAERAGVSREALVLAATLIPKLSTDNERDAAWLALAESSAGLDPEKGLSLFQQVKDRRQIESSAIFLCHHYARRRRIVAP